jgi:3-oxoacyl-[acyl-carrier protein] reductase
MDFGIRGRRALVCGGSRGLGRGCAEALAGEGVEIVLNGRDAARLAEAAAALRATGAKVAEAPGDVTTAEGREAVLGGAGEIDILVTNAAGPPPGTWDQADRAAILTAVEANLIAPVLLMQALLPGMMARGWSRVVNITSTSVKAPIAELTLSNTARAGLTAYVAGTARAVAGQGVTINNLLPGRHATDRIRMLDQARAKAEGLTEEEFARRSAARIPAGRYGTAAEFGAACAFLCSVQAGYIVGQNLLIDGGAVSATI